MLQINLSLLVFLLFIANAAAGPVMNITTNTESELEGTISCVRSDAPFGVDDVGALRFDARTETTTETVPILFNNFPGTEVDQNLTLVDVEAAPFFELELFSAGGDVIGDRDTPLIIGPDPITREGKLTGSYSTGLSGGLVNYEMSVLWPLDNSATRTATFRFASVPEPSAFLTLGLVALFAGSTRWFRQWSTGKANADE